MPVRKFIGAQAMPWQKSYFAVRYLGYWRQDYFDDDGSVSISEQDILNHILLEHPVSAGWLLMLDQHGAAYDVGLLTSSFDVSVSQACKVAIVTHLMMLCLDTEAEVLLRLTATDLTERLSPR